MKLITIGLNCSEPACDNFTSESYYVYDRIQNIILIATYIPLFLIALTSNILVIVVVSRYRCLRSVTNYFLVNLSLADLMVTLVCMPMAVGQSIYSLWIYGDFMCKLTHYLKGVSVSASVFTITACSVDRYLAINHPMSRKLINRRTTTKVIFVLWVLSFLIFSPIVAVRESEGYKFLGDSREYLYCVEIWPDSYSQKAFGIFCFVTVYLIPGFIVILAYSLMGLRLCSRQLLPEYEITHETNSRGDGHSSASTNSAWQVSAVGGRLIRERRRVAKILLVLALVFAVCWLPYSVLSLILDVSARSAPSPYDEGGDVNSTSAGSASESDEHLSYIADFLPFAILLGHSQAAVNPLLYCLLSKNFRRSVTDLIRHPTRVIRNRQQCKIRMTFRKDPVPSAEPNSNSDKPTASRPRNHHAPDPPKPVSSPCNTAMIMEPGDIRLGDLGNKQTNSYPNGIHAHHDLVVAYSPSQSSSGYSSLRGSDNNQCCQQCAQFQTYVVNPNSPSNNSNCSYCSMSYCAYPHIPAMLCQSCQGQCATTLIFGKRNCSTFDCRKVHVPSTIREESENSHLSQRSKSNASAKVCFG